MGMHSTRRSFQIDQPFERVFYAAPSAVQAVDRSVLTGVNIHQRVITFDTSMGWTSWGEDIVVGFIPRGAATVVEITCSTKGLPNLMQISRNRSIIDRYITALSNMVQAPAIEVAKS